MHFRRVWILYSLHFESYGAFLVWAFCGFVSMTSKLVHHDLIWANFQGRSVVLTFGSRISGRHVTDRWTAMLKGGSHNRQRHKSTLSILWTTYIVQWVAELQVTTIQYVYSLQRLAGIQPAYSLQRGRVLILTITVLRFSHGHVSLGNNFQKTVGARFSSISISLPRLLPFPAFSPLHSVPPPLVPFTYHPPSLIPLLHVFSPSLSLPLSLKSRGSREDL